MITGYSTSIRSIHDAVAQLNKGAQRIQKDEVIDGLISMTKAVRQAQANITALRISDRLTKSLLDIYG